MTDIIDARPPVAEPARGEDTQKLSAMKRQRVLWGWVFLSPWIIGFLAFLFIPMLASLAFTFTDFNLNQPDEIQFVGLDNYNKLLNDPSAGTSLRVTVLFLLISLPFSIVIPLALAMLLNARNLWGKALFRTLFYMPFIVPAVSLVGIWRGYLNTQSGWLNRILVEIGLGRPDWLNSETLIYPALLLVGVWGTGNAMLVMLAGLQGVPTALYEAARVDGAGWWKQTRHITIPMISPVIFYNLILSTVGLFRYFDIPYMLKDGTGEPGQSTLFFNIYLYKRAFVAQDMGYGATLAWMLFLVAITFTIFLFWSARYWVYYSGDAD
jgi:multiple sugar transport system permease protein